MRIIAGKNKSRKLMTLDGLDTRPMMDKMKESVFNAIGPYFEGDICLDLFGGSGALTLESLSRGASFGYIVEKSFQAMKIIKENVTNLNETNNVILLNMDYKTALNKFVKEETKFDIIFLDPPYKLNIVDEIVTFIIKNELLKSNGIIVCQYVRHNYQAIDRDNLKVIKNYNYASSEICIYQKV